MMAFFLSFFLAQTSPSGLQAIGFIKDDIQPVIQFAMDWSMQAAMAATSTHAFIVLCKRFLD